jgi:hypothetical protein
MCQRSNDIRVIKKRRKNGVRRELEEIKNSYELQI